EAVEVGEGRDEGAVDDDGGVGVEVGDAVGVEVGAGEAGGAVAAEERVVRPEGRAEVGVLPGLVPLGREAEGGEAVARRAAALGEGARRAVAAEGAVGLVEGALVEVRLGRLGRQHRYGRGGESENRKVRMGSCVSWETPPFLAFFTSPFSLSQAASASAPTSFLIHSYPFSSSSRASSGPPERTIRPPRSTCTTSGST